MKVTKNHVVSMHYTLTAPDGTELDSSAGADPLRYLHGSGNIIPGLEKALEGKGAGDQLNVEIPPEDAYGPRQPELVQDVPKNAFQGVDEIQAGQSFRAQGADGSQRSITVLAVEGDNVKIDGNHPLAGITLKFDITVVEVREASQEEIDHGHVH
jgi:FKBP-type peptidyl-prolyl cis-trans isomerase SlyD